MNLFGRSGIAMFSTLLALPAAGCSGIPVHDEATGTTHHVILGFGIVSVSDPARAPEVTAVRIHALGLAASTGPVGGVALGYKSATAVQAAPDANVSVEIGEGAFGPLSVSQNPPHPNLESDEY